MTISAAKSYVDILNLGLAGLLVFLVFVIEKLLRGLRKESPVLFPWLYSFFWLVTFGIISLIAYRGFMPSEATLAGTVENLTDPETIRATDTAADFYTLQKYRNKRSEIFDLHWRITTASQIKSLSFRLYKTAADDGDSYIVPVEPTAYKNGLKLRYHRESNRLTVLKDGTEENLSTVNREQPSGLHWPWQEQVAYAEEKTSLDVLFSRLQSNDPRIRSEARRDIAKEGHSAIPSIEKVLVNADSSYLLRVGALSALTRIPASSSAISLTTFKAVDDMRKDRDPVIRDIASNLIENAESVKKEADSASETVWRIARPTLTQLETSYNQIQLRPGDVVKITAGGCVQPGGSGLTWKRYVDPQGPDSASRHFALIRMPGEAAQSKLSSVIGKTLTVSQAGPLALGYKDDYYPDNGYWKKDDGVGGQCKGQPDASVTVQIQHTRK